jgi:hypothetical protein
MADSVNLLNPNQRFVIEANDPDSQSSGYLRQFEEKYEFRIFTQWTDNYVCDHVRSNKSQCRGGSGLNFSGSGFCPLPLLLKLKMGLKAYKKALITGRHENLFKKY